MTENLDKLRDFISSFRASLDFRLWLKLVQEEAAELEEALEKKDKEEILKEATDLRYVLGGLMFFVPVLGEGLVKDDELLEIKEVLDNATAVALKAFPLFSQEVHDEAFKRVHESNMSKLGEDGKPILREDGKVLKGPNYKPANLSDLIEEK